jgi:Flp pilus assembly protein TadD
MAREGVMARPVTGYGQEGFNYVFNQFYRPSLYAQEPWFDRAHNVFVDWLVAGGIPAFVLFISLLISAVVGLYRSTIPRAERIFLTAGLAAYALQALVVFDNLFTYVPLAAILAMVHFSWSRPITWMEQKPALSPAALNTSVAPIALVVGVAIVWMVNIPTMQTAGNLVYAISGLPGGPEENLRYFKRAIADGGTITQEVAEQLVGTAGSVVGQVQLPESLRREYAGLAIESILKEVANAPRDARLHMQAAIAFRSVGENDLALAHIDQAIALSPKKQMFYLEKGLQLSQTGKAQEARDVFHYAYALDPSFPQIATYAAAGDILAGNYEEGKAFLLKEVGTTSVNSMALVRAYFETKHFEDLIDVLLAQVAEEPTTDSKLRLLTAYVLAGRVSDARAWGSQIIKEYPAATAQVQSILATPPA